jgi:pimeloyl-ACP methyl ester carboxylesterase
MATFILVHGAWHWGGCWQEVRQQLEAAGHRVETPTLLGMGETASLLKQHPRPRIGVMTHIRQVTEVVRQSADPEGVVLVAHSYAGIVASGVVQELARQGEHHKIAHLVFLDAMVPTPQQATTRKLFTVNNPPTWLQPWIKEHLSLGKMIRSTPIPPPPLRLMGFVDETSAQARRVADHLTSFPVLFSEGVKKFAPPMGIPITYLHCQPDFETVDLFTSSVQAFAHRHRWTVDTLPCGHDAMILLPTALSMRLLQVLDRQEPSNVRALPGGKVGRV